MREEDRDDRWRLAHPRPLNIDLIPDEHRREVDCARQRRHRERSKDVTVSRVTERDSHEISRQKEYRKSEETLEETMG